MSKGSKFKDRVRARMERTGESWMTARRHVEASHVDGGGAATGGGSADIGGAAAAVGGDGGRVAPPGSLDAIAAAYKRNRTAFREESLRAWKSLVERLLNGAADRRWDATAEIVAVLAEVGRAARLNHVFFPDGGGLDLITAELSPEPGCVELLLDGLWYVMKATALHLVQPARDPDREWAFLWLETGPLAASGVYEAVPDELRYEPVIRLSSGQYVDAQLWEAEGIFDYDEDGSPLPLPDGARALTRHFGGPFLIMAKGSAYNSLDKYWGGHARFSRDAFAADVHRFVMKLHNDGTYGVDFSLRKRGL